MARGRRSSWGSVEKRAPGVWRIRYRVGPPGATRRMSETVRGTRRQAEDRLAELRLECRDPVSAGRVATVGYLHDAYWSPDIEERHEAGEIAGSYHRSRTTAWRLHVAPRWAGVAVADVRPQDVQEWLLGLGSHGAAENGKQVLGAILNYAVMYGYVATNVARLPYRMPPKGDGMDKGIYDADGLRRVLEAVRGDVIEPAIILMGLGSCRVGESLGVRCDEVRRADAHGVAAAVAPVERQVTREEGVTGKLKNPQSHRTVVVPGPPGERLLEIAAARLAAGAVWLADDGTGRPISRGTLADRWERIAKGAPGIEYHPTRNLRNSWQTLMHWTLGLDPTIIEKLMGHRGETVTARHYDRPKPEMLVEAVTRAYAERPFADGWDHLAPRQ